VPEELGFRRAMIRTVKLSAEPISYRHHPPCRYCRTSSLTENLVAIAIWILA